MTKKEFERLTGLFNNDFCEVTPSNLVMEITRKIVNCKYMSDIEKATTLSNYYGNLIDNESTVERINNYINERS